MALELSAEEEAALQEQLEPEEQLLLEVDEAAEVQMVTRSGFSPNRGRGPSQQGVRATTSTCWPCCRCQCRWQPRPAAAVAAPAAHGAAAIHYDRCSQLSGRLMASLLHVTRLRGYAAHDADD